MWLPWIPDGVVASHDWVPGATTHQVTGPLGEDIGTIGVADARAVDSAAQLAARAQPAWAALPGEQRAEVMDRAAELLQEREVEVRRLLAVEAGATWARSEIEVRRAVAELRYAATTAREHAAGTLPSRPGESSFVRVPVGVVGVISPWNAPLVLALRSVAPALALGNAVVHKPDLRTPVCGGLAIVALLWEAGLPKDVLHVLPGGVDVGTGLVEHPQVPVISFTGSTGVGREVGRSGGYRLKRVLLELGGNNALIVLDDAEIAAAASAGARGSFGHQGQICMATGRHLVHETRYAEYVERLAAAAAALRVGDPSDRDVQIGPVIDAREAARITSLVDRSVDASARLVVGGRADGPLVQPTVLAEAGAGVPAFEEEIFGPVAAVTSFRDESELFDLVRSSAYELTSAVWTRDLERGSRLSSSLPAGCAHVNASTVRNDPDAPFGAFGLSGNGAFFGGPANVESFTRYRWHTIGG